MPGSCQVPPAPLPVFSLVTGDCPIGLSALSFHEATVSTWTEKCGQYSYPRHGMGNSCHELPGDVEAQETGCTMRKTKWDF